MSTKNLNGKIKTAYFSMEIGFHDQIPSYSGGLGILAGDTLKAAADLGIDMVGVTLLYKHGYFKQVIDHEGRQKEEQEQWDVDKYLTKTSARAVIYIEDRPVNVHVWEYVIQGLKGEVPIYFLDTDFEENDPRDRQLCSNLYPVDKSLKLNQSILLGIGGVKILRDIGYQTFDNYHLNETHPWPVILELKNLFYSKENVRKHLVFTTHTPLAGGHQRYSQEELDVALEGNYLSLIPQELYGEDDNLNTAVLCLEYSKYANGVAEKHQEVSSQMYPHYKINAVTNGIHVGTWVNPYLAKSFDMYTPLWREAGFNLRQALSIPIDNIQTAHQAAKKELIDLVNEQREGAHSQFDPNTFTIGFARRAATYKRHNLIFTDIDRLTKIAQKHGGIQFIFAGKAYPNDEGGKQVIKEIMNLNRICSGNLKVFFMQNYSIGLSHKILSGVDVWLNNPEPPLEASGTSGMKAALNGIPNFSVLDGWWLEGCVEGITGWAIGEGRAGKEFEKAELESMYTKLDQTILPLYYKDKEAWGRVQRHAIALNASYFNTHRMMMEYLTEAYIIND